MFVALCFNYCARQAIFSIYPVLKSELRFSDAQLGLIGSVFSFIYGFGSPVAGEIGDKFSKKGLVLLSMILWSLFTVLTGFSASIAFLLACRASIGLSESLFMPAAIALTGSAYPPAARSRALGILKTAQILGVVIGGWFGGFMADCGQWRLAFFILGAVGLLYAIPYHFCLRQYRRPLFAETKSSGGLFALVALVKIPSYLLLGAVFGIESFGLWLLYAWLPSFFREKFSLDLAHAALAATAYLQGATFLGIVGGGWLADRLYSRRPSIRFESVAWGMIVCCPCLHLIGHCRSEAGTALAAVGLGLGTGWLMTNVFSAAFDIVPADARASSIGILNLFSAVGAGLGPLLGGLWKQSLGIGNLLSLTGIAYALSGVVMLVGIKIWFGRDYARVHWIEPATPAP
jgi:MFS family permease